MVSHRILRSAMKASILEPRSLIWFSRPINLSDLKNDLSDKSENGVIGIIVYEHTYLRYLSGSDFF